MVYDCPRHPVSSLAALHNYQYLPSSSGCSRMQTLATDAISLFAQLYTIVTGVRDPDEEKPCSAACFRLIDHKKYKELACSSKLSSFSPIAMMKIHMGV